MNASDDQTDHDDRARLVDSCGARDDSPSSNLVRAKQGDTIRVDGTSPRGRGQEDVKKSERERGVLQSATKATTRGKTKEIDASVTRLPGNGERSENNPINEEE